MAPELPLSLGGERQNIMMGNQDRRQIPQASEDHTTLRGETIGGETLYTIQLKGFIDDRWAEAYRITQAESVLFKRFRLDRSTATIAFSCRTVDGAIFVFDVLEHLQTLLKSVNDRVEFWHTQNPAVTPVYSALGVA